MVSQVFAHKSICTLLLPVLITHATAEPLRHGRIVFHSDRSGNSEIYSIATDGSDEAQLTFDEGFDGFPSWSPDGEQIVFQSNRDGEFAIYSMHADGFNLVRIPNTENGSYAKYSPGGEHIAFFAERNGVTDIYLIGSAGEDIRNITNSSAIDETPSWSADGATIAFQSDRSWRKTLTTDPDPEQHPNFGIFTMVSNGSDVVEVTGLESVDENPSINPNGGSIVFQRYIDDGLSIALIDLNSGKTRILTAPAEISGSPAWSSSGTQIVFDSMRDGNFDIFVMDENGENLHQVTTSEDTENSGAALFDGNPSSGSPLK
jgi:Tol biopolymer transport system component